MFIRGQLISYMPVTDLKHIMNSSILEMVKVPIPVVPIQSFPFPFVVDKPTDRLGFYVLEMDQVHDFVRKATTA